MIGGITYFHMSMIGLLLLMLVEVVTGTFLWHIYNNLIQYWPQ